MAILTNTSSAIMIVPELLERGNYRSWSIFMEDYLISQELWDGIIVPFNADQPLLCESERKKRNAAALNAIKISCGPESFVLIKYTRSAREAWDMLAEMHKIEPEANKSTPKMNVAMASTKKEEEEEEEEEITKATSEHEEEEKKEEEEEITKATSEHEEEENSFQTMERTKSLFVQNAINKGDVDAVRDFFKRNPGAEKLRFWTGDTSLHYSATVGKLNIVKALLESTPAVQKDAWNNTALSNAAQYGNTEIAKYLLSKDSTLLSMEDDEEEIPVVTACREGHKEVTYFLYSKTPFEILLRENGKQGSQILLSCFNSETFDIMFDALHRCPSLIDECWKDLLDEFAESPTAFISGSGLTFWQRWIYECLKAHIPSDFFVVTINQEEKNFEEIPLPGRLWRLASILLPFLGIKQTHALMLSHRYARASLCLICEHLTKLNWTKLEDMTAPRKALARAIENGIYDFLIEMVETNADLLFAPRPVGDETTTINFLMDAIAFRQDKIARFLFRLPIGQVYISSYNSQGGSVLHMAAKLASDSQLSHISGAALQMQREIQWFKEVESLVPQCVKNAENDNGETAYQVLAREHKDLLKEAEDWMKGLAGSYILVGILTVTIMFAAAFTLPGGNNQTYGFPIFKNKAAFMIYIISDAISLFAATASVIIFLGFLTSRYNMEDFHKSIPRKLMAGLSTMFISLVAMMIAFCSAIFLMLQNQWWIIIPSLLLAAIPVSLFARLQFPLLCEIYVLTYKSPIFSKKRCLASEMKAFFFGKKKIE